MARNLKNVTLRDFTSFVARLQSKQMFARVAQLALDNKRFDGGDGGITAGVILPLFVGTDEESSTHSTSQVSHRKPRSRIVESRADCQAALLRTLRRLIRYSGFGIGVIRSRKLASGAGNLSLTC